MKSTIEELPKDPKDVMKFFIEGPLGLFYAAISQVEQPDKDDFEVVKQAFQDSAAGGYPAHAALWRMLTNSLVGVSVSSLHVSKGGQKLDPVECSKMFENVMEELTGAKPT